MVTRSVFSTAEGVVVRVFDSMCAIEPAEVVEQEEAVFWAFVIFLPEPEAVVRKRQFKVAASDVCVLLAVFFGNDFGEEPAIEVCCVFAVFGEVLSHHGNAVYTELFFDHACHRVAFATVLTKVFASSSAKHRDSANIKSCASGTAFSIAEAVLGSVGIHGTVVPVEHHHGEDLREAFAKNARIIDMNFGSAILISNNPDCIANGECRIEQNRGECGITFDGAIGADICCADGLLEVNPCAVGRLCNHAFEPTAIRGTYRAHVVFHAIQEHDGVGVCPRGEEADMFFRFDRDRRFSVGNRQGLVIVDDDPDFFLIVNVFSVLNGVFPVIGE